jgi:hypothetical protein
MADFGLNEYREVQPQCYIWCMSWVVLLDVDVEAWFLRLAEEDPDSAEQVEAAINILQDVGPTLGAPLVKKIDDSGYHHMKELRPGSSGSTEVRILFAFDPQRQAILLVAGDKSGSWNTWYDKNIPIADARYKAHLKDMEGRR